MTPTPTDPFNHTQSFTTVNTTQQISCLSKPTIHSFLYPLHTLLLLLTCLFPLALVAKNYPAECPILDQNSFVPRSKALLPTTCNANHFTTSVSLLIWQATEDGLAFAAKNFATQMGDIRATLLQPDFSWAPACKVLVGYHFPAHSWDLNGRWTFFYTKSKQGVHSPVTDAGAGLLPLWMPEPSDHTSPPVYGSAKEKLSLHVNAVDIELAYTGGLSRSLFMQVHGGLKGLAIKQSFDVSYGNALRSTTGASILNNLSTEISSAKMHATNLCRGIGPRFGFGSKWVLAGGWSLLAECAAAFALSEMETKRRDILTQNDNQSEELTFQEAFWVWRPVAEAKMGAQWDLCFGTNPKNLSVQATYEMQQYWEQNMTALYANRSLSYAPFNARGNLILQGFSVTASIRY